MAWSWATYDEIKHEIRPGDVILLKGSRRMGLEKVVEDILGLQPQQEATG